MPRELLTEAAAGFIFAAALYMCVTAVLGSGKPARIIPAAGLMIPLTVMVGVIAAVAAAAGIWGSKSIFSRHQVC